MTTVLLLGCGDIARRIGARHLAMGHQVIGAARSSEGLAAAAALGITPMACDFDTVEETLPQADRAYYCAAPPNAGEQDPRLHRALAHLPVPSQGLLYVSTSGVYGDCQGRWIDECETLKPQTARGKRRLAAERGLRAWAAASSARTVTLRVPGIYGPGRLPEARLRAGTPILRLEDSPFTNRIHADDLAEAAILALTKGEALAAYHVSDGTPSSMSAYFLRVAALLGLPEPEQISMAQARTTLSAQLLSFFEESKRLDTSRLRALGFVPRYPSLAEGLPSCIEQHTITAQAQG